MFFFLLIFKEWSIAEKRGSLAALVNFSLSYTSFQKCFPAIVGPCDRRCLVSAGEDED